MIYQITPYPKPRMTQSDKWKQRKCVMLYRAFKDQVRAAGLTLPDSGYHMTFILPMPPSWSVKKRMAMNGKPHQTSPDKDNLEKAVLDAIFGRDEHVWDGRVTKLWGEVGQIKIEVINDLPR